MSLIVPILKQTNHQSLKKTICEKKKKKKKLQNILQKYLKNVITERSNTMFYYSQA